MSGTVASLVHAVKYQGNRAAAPILGDLLYYSLTLPDCDVIVPVPMHWYKRWQRGYNQAESIANRLAQHLHKPCLPLVIRQHYTSPQALVGKKDERAARLHNVFALHPYFASCSFARTRILLVDDVVTTGSTFTACAEALAQKNPAAIHAVAVGHGK